MKYRFEFRAANGTSCCKSDSIDNLCDKCRTLANTAGHQSRHAAERAPAPPSLTDLIRNGPKPHVMEAVPPPEPRTVSRMATTRERMPSPPSLAEAYRTTGGAR